jgi:hypothetical protein
MRNNHRFIAKKHHCFYAQQFVLVTIINESLFLIVFQHSTDTSIYFVITDPIVVEVECGECLCEKKGWEIGWKDRDVTLFCWRAVARCCAPSSPIWLPKRLSVVSVYVKQKEWEIWRKDRDVTLFCWRAVARCCAPSSPISL